MPEQFITPTRIAHTTVNSVVAFQTTEKDLLVDPSRLVGRNKNMQQPPNPKIPSTFSSCSSSSAIHPDHYPFDRTLTVHRQQQQQQQQHLVPLQSTCNSQSPGLGQQQQHQPQQQQQDDDNDDDSPLGTTADELKMSPTRVADFPGSIAHSSPSPSSSSSSPSSSPSSSSSSSAGNGGGFGPNRSLRSKLAVVLSSPSLRRHHHHHRGHDVSAATGGSSSPSKPNAAAVAVMVSSSSSTLVSSSALSSSSSSSSSQSSFPNATLTASSSSLSSNSGSSTSSIYRHLAHPDLTSRVRVGGGSRNGGSSSSGGGAGSGMIMTRNGNGIHTRRRRRRHPLQANAHLHHPCRRQAPFQSALPTLDETSSSDEESHESSSSPSSSYDDDDDEHDARNNQNTNPNQQSATTCAGLRDTVEGHEPSSPIPQCAEATDRTSHSLSPVSQGDASSLTSLLDEATKTKSGGDPGSKLQRLIRLCSEAAVCAATGEEDAAVATYKKALQWAAGEIVHIQVQLRCCKQGKHPTSAVASIQDRLLQDWLLIGDELVEIQTALAVLYERTGNYKLAISAMQETVDIYSSQKTECRKNLYGKYSNSLRTSTRKTTTKTPEQQNRHDKIADGIRRAQDRMARMKKASASYEDRKKQHAEIILVRKRIATTQHPVTRVKLFQQVEQMVKTVQELEVATLGWQHAQIADTLTLLSTIATEQGDFEKGIAYAKDAADIDQVVVGMRHPKLGQDYLNLARLYSRKSNLGVDQQAEEQAIEYYHRAVNVFRHSSTCQVVVGSALNDLAIVHIRRQEHEIALKLLQESLDAYKAEAIVGTNNNSSNSSTNGMCLDAVQVWRNLGECYTQLREFQLATDAFVSALDFQRDARKEREAAASLLLSSSSSSSSTSDIDPVKEDGGDIVHVDLIHDESVADTLRRLGKAYMNQQKFAEAKVVFLEAAGIHQVAVEQAKNRSDGPLSGASGNGDIVSVALDELAQTLYGVAEAHLAEEDYTTAIRIFDESMHLRLESDVVRAKHNGNYYRPLNNVHCAMCHVGIGNANLRLSKAREAYRSFQEALRHCVAHGIPAGHSIHLMITNRMKETEEEIQQLAAQGNVDELEWLAEVEIRRTSLDRAIEILSRVMSIRRANLKRLKSDKLDSTQEKLATACTLERFGRVLETKGELVEADRALKDASKLFHKVGKPARAQEVEAIIKRLHAS